MLHTGNLIHGGVMANYRCTAACRHCLYACSPKRAGDYISRSQAEAICALLGEGGIGSIHIGGGEPFLHFEGLLELAQAARRAGIPLDYVETNGYWVSGNDHSAALKKLERLREAGVDALCISLDPFHGEYIPPERPLLLARLCAQAGMGYFLWKEQYLTPLRKLGLGERHSREEMEAVLGPRYLWETARSYGMTFGGRALNLEEEFLPRLPPEQLLDPSPCTGLLSTHHFHADLYSRFLPPGCTGIALPLAEAVHGIPDGKYPVLEALLHGGVAALWKYALHKGFSPGESGYSSSCALCFHLRDWLSLYAPTGELDPTHYRASRTYYHGTPLAD